MTWLPKFSVENRVLVHVLMLAILCGGAYTALTIVRAMFPEFRPNQVMISTDYPGATPLEVEKGLALRIEEAIKDVEDVDKIETRISEGTCTLLVTLTSDDSDLDQKVNDFKAAIDAIPPDELPEQAEQTRVSKFQPRLPVISVAIYGDVGEAVLKAAADNLRDDLLLLDEVSEIKVNGTRDPELTVEVLPEKLLEYKLSLAQVSDAIRHSNLDLPGGQLKTSAQNVAVRTLGETDDAQRIADTIVRTTTRGELVRVRDLGRVLDGFEDRDVRGRFNGKPAVDVTVYKTGDQDAIDMAERVNAYVAGKRREPLELNWLTRLENAIGIRTEAQQIHQRSWNEPLAPGLTVMAHSNLARYI